MCRLFALSGGAEPVSTELWLLDASNSLIAQSARNPDGTGLGYFDDAGRPVVHRVPIAAAEDLELACEARHVHARTFVGHVRHATTGALTVQNTHPFEQEGRMFAHNGVVGDLPRLVQRLGADRPLVLGDTDSERLFALITHEIRRREGDVRSGLIAAVRWVAAELPLLSINLILATPSDLYALRYPDTNTLLVLERAAGGQEGGDRLEHRSSLGTRLVSEDAAQRPVVVIASEAMDDDPGWRPLACGELLHVGAALDVTSEIVLPDPPAHLLHPAAAAGRGADRPR